MKYFNELLQKIVLMKYLIEKKILLNLEGTKIVKYLIVKYNMKRNRERYILYQSINFL